MFKYSSLLVSLRILPSILLLSLLACAEDLTPDIAASDTGGRWYSLQQIEIGKNVYEKNCIACHLEKTQGTFSWKKRLADGSYPPPPLNGSAHAWHHSKATLLSVINDGGMPAGGKMPAFRNILSEDEKHAVIAYFQSYWADEIYQQWLKIDQQP